MIIDNTYFIGEIYIPNAKPSVSSDVTTVASDLNLFINKYEKDCLLRCLGYSLYADFVDNLDLTKPTYIKDGADAKWDELLNGKIYTINNKQLQWNGIRFKNSSSDKKPNRSFLANYVYWFYEQDYDVFRAGVGNVKGKSKNAENVSSAPKVVRAWNEMVYMIRGKQTQPVYIHKPFGIGVDYYQNSNEVDLYKFIKDMNILVSNTYENFTPSYWGDELNEFGI